MPVPFLKRAKLLYLTEESRLLLGRPLPKNRFPFLEKKADTVCLLERLKGGPFKLRVR